MSTAIPFHRSEAITTVTLDAIFSYADSVESRAAKAAAQAQSEMNKTFEDMDYINYVPTPALAEAMAQACGYIHTGAAQ